MKAIRNVLLTLFIGLIVFNMNVFANTLKTGDIAFTAFNADGNDDFAIVTFVDLEPNTVIIFCDSELNGQGQFGADENDFSWNSGSNSIPKGTVITFNNISDASRSVSLGSIIGTPGGMSATDEAMFAFIGSTPRTATTFLAAIGNTTTSFGDLANSGLVRGTTAIVLNAGTDIGQYKGTRSGLNVNGFIASLNNIQNWDLQDDGNDNQNDNIVPDLPFNTSIFTFVDTDLLSPTVASVTLGSLSTTSVVFSEDVNENDAENLANYSFSPSLNIQSAVYNSSTQTVTLTHNNLNIGVFYSLTVDNIKDLADNEMTEASVKGNLVFNNTMPKLVITEIMYNLPGTSGNDYEFIEIYNAGVSNANIGGLKVKDESNFVVVLPELTLAPGNIVLLASNADTAAAFYKKTFIDIPGSGNFLGNGGEKLDIINSLNESIFTVTYDDASPWPLEPDGQGQSLQIVNPSNNANDGTNWLAATNNLGSNGSITVFASPGVFTPASSTPNINFSAVNYVTNENSGSVNVELKLNNSFPLNVACSLKVVSNFGTANSNDFTFANQIVTIDANTTSKVITIPILDNMTFNPSKLFMLEISNPINANLGSTLRTTVYIKENEKGAPVGNNTLGMTHVKSFKPSATGTAEIVVHDPSTQRLYVMNSTQSRVEIFDFSNPANPTYINTIDMSQYGPAATSVSVKNGIVAATVDPETFENGIVVFFDLDGNNERIVEVGNLPDMVTFSPDGHYAMTANEGQPNQTYDIDPEGSVSIIDISGGLNSIDQSKVTTMTFNAFDSQRQEFIDAGIRIFGLNNPTVSEDFEPEYITISDDSQTAWVSIQENNAIAVIDMMSKEIVEVLPLGYKDHTLPQNSLDASDQFSSNIFMANWPVKGVYMPDAIAHYEVNGTPFIISANEGDAREYSAFEELVRISTLNLDPTIFPNASYLKINTNIGRLNASNATGDTDGDGDIDEIHILGSRSFSIWNGVTGQQIYDSGNQLELITAEDQTYGSLFNASNSNNNFKNRSDDKGPEPEGVTTGKIEDKTYAFIALERTGGVVTYDVTNPAAPIFENYINTRALGSTLGGDNGAEGIVYVSPENSTTGFGYVITANEISGTVAIFKLENVKVRTKPEVVTYSTVESITSNSAEISAEIVNNGNVEITQNGFVYSSMESMPTLENGTIVYTDVMQEGELNAELMNLMPETTYNFTVFATNSKGTSYGEVFTFTTLAKEPTRQTQRLSFYKIGKSVLGLKWTKGNGANRILIASENSLTSGDYLTDGENYLAGNFGTVLSNVQDAYIVYNGNAASFDVTGLQNNKTYYFRAFEFNGYYNTTNYLESTITGNPNSRSTLKKEADEVVVVGNLLNVYPNPAKDVLNLDLNMNLENANLIIVDETGKELINTTEVKNFMSLDLSNFSNGSYYLLITNGDEAIYNSFIIKK